MRASHLIFARPLPIFLPTRFKTKILGKLGQHAILIQKNYEEEYRERESTWYSERAKKNGKSFLSTVAQSILKCNNVVEQCTRKYHNHHENGAQSVHRSDVSIDSPMLRRRRCTVGCESQGRV